MLEEFLEVVQVLQFFCILECYEESSKKVPNSFLAYKYISIIFFSQIQQRSKRLT